MKVLPPDLIEAARNGRILPFVGAGVSMAVVDREGKRLFPSWKELLLGAADRLERNGDAPRAALVRVNLDVTPPEYLEAAKQAKKGLGNNWSGFLRESLPREFEQATTESLELARKVWALGSHLIVTTNYDQVLEWACPKLGPQSWDIESRAEMLAEIQGQNKTLTVWHMHGRDSNVAELILTPDGYSALYGDEPDKLRHEAALETFHNLILQRSLLFIGAAGDDEYVLRQLMSQMKKFGGESGNHFALLRKGSSARFGSDGVPVHVIEFDDFGAPLLEVLDQIGGKRSQPEPKPPKPPDVSPAGNREIDATPTDIPPVPNLDSTRIRTRFVGRSVQLRDLQHDLDVIRSAAGQAEFVAPQLTWVYGFGGMGKSWFLRTACFRAANAGIRTALIDWNQTEWCYPSSIPPRDPRDVVNAIAYRIAQIFGPEVLEDYWKARVRVDEAWGQHAILSCTLDEALTCLEIKGQSWREAFQKTDGGAGSSSIPQGVQTLEQILRQRDEWPEKSQDLEQRARSIRQRLRPYDLAEGDDAEAIAASWYQQIAGSDVVARPVRHLVEALQGCLRKLCRQSPLLLALDTYEILGPDLDGWVRGLFAGLFDGRTPILVLIGGRHRIDWYVHAGEPGGWRQKVGAGRIRISPFDEDVRFTAADIADILRDVSPPVPADSGLAEAVFRATLGVPIALGMLLQMHEESGDEDVLPGILALDRGAADDPDGRRAVETVIAAVAARFMYYLEKPKNAEDLRSIRQLALMRRPLESALACVWGSDKVRAKLRKLAQRHEVMAGGDLHPTVRDYLQRHWRTEPFDGLTEMASQLREAVEGVEPKVSPSESEWAEWDLERLNLRAWEKGEAALPEFARELVVFVVHDHDVVGLLNRARMIEASSPTAKNAKEMLRPERWIGFSPDPESLQWVLHYVKEWTPLSKASSDLLGGMLAAENGRNKEAVEKLQRAIEVFGDNLPRSYRVVEAIMRSAQALGQTSQNVDLSRLAAQIGDRYGIAEAGVWNMNYYWNLHNSRQYDRAEEYCRSVVAESPRNQMAYWALGHILGVHLGRPHEAEAVFRDGLEKGEEPNIRRELGELLTNLGRPEEALTQFEKIRGHIYGLKDNLKLRMLIANLLLLHLGRQTEAKAQISQAADELDAYLKGTASEMEEACREVARAMYLADMDLKRAEGFARRAAGEKLEYEGLWMLSAILIRRGGRWTEAEPILRKYWRLVHTDNLVKGWDEELLMFRDAVKQGKAAWLADKLVPDVPIQRVLRMALLTAAGEPVEVPVQAREMVAELIRQFSNPKPNDRFPNVPALSALD